MELHCFVFKPKRNVYLVYFECLVHTCLKNVSYLTTDQQRQSRERVKKMCIVCSKASSFRFSFREWFMSCHLCVPDLKSYAHAVVREIGKCSSICVGVCGREFFFILFCVFSFILPAISPFSAWTHATRAGLEWSHHQIQRDGGKKLSGTVIPFFPFALHPNSQQ